jgi:dUTP pyrophosphatase
MIVKVKKLDRSASLPEYAHPGDAGMDLFAKANLEIPPGESRLVGTGIAIELPAATEAQIRPRSGLALKHTVTVLNSPGTVDEGYRGEVGVIMINHGKHTFVVNKGMRIAQMVIKPVLRVEVAEVEAGVSDLQAQRKEVKGIDETLRKEDVGRNGSGRNIQEGA